MPCAIYVFEDLKMHDRELSQFTKTSKNVQTNQQLINIWWQNFPQEAPSRSTEIRKFYPVDR